MRTMKTVLLSALAGMALTVGIQSLAEPKKSPTCAEGFPAIATILEEILSRQIDTQTRITAIEKEELEMKTMQAMYYSTHP